MNTSYPWIYILKDAISKTFGEAIREPVCRKNASIRKLSVWL